MANDTVTLWTVGVGIDRFVDTDDDSGETIVSITHIVVAANSRGDRYRHVNGFPLMESQPHPERRSAKLASRVRAAIAGGLAFSPVNNRHWEPMEPRPGSPAAVEAEQIRQREQDEFEAGWQREQEEAYGAVEQHAVTWVP